MADKFLDFNELSRYTSKIVERFRSFVPSTRTVNGKPLSDDIKLTAADVGVQACGSYVFLKKINPTSILTASVLMTKSLQIRYQKGERIHVGVLA